MTLKERPAILNGDSKCSYLSKRNTVNCTLVFVLHSSWPLDLVAP